MSLKDELERWRNKNPNEYIMNGFIGMAIELEKKEELKQALFIEMIRAYHDGLGVHHGAVSYDQVFRDAKRDAQLAVDIYFKESSE